MSDAPTSERVLRIDNASFVWPGTGFALEVSDFGLEAGERALLVGESGAGKSTLLSLICGVLRPSSGSIQVAGKDITTLRSSALDRLRADKFGIIFQMFNLLPFASALENVLLPLRFARARRVDAPREAAASLLIRLGLPEDAVHAKAGTLSVGQQQRVAAARALIGSPPIVIADEPTSALDKNTAAEFMTLLIQETTRTKAALLMVSHDERLAGHFDRVVSLDTIARSTRKSVA